METAKDIQVIVITCLDDIDSKITGVQLGADDFLIKPINTRELKARIKVLLEKKDLTGETKRSILSIMFMKKMASLI